jgi:hypothetical protein
MTLDHKVALYIPSTVAVNKPCPDLQGRMTDLALEQLSRLFGGATRLPAVGAWVSETHGLVKEPINFVFSFTDETTLSRHVDAVLGLAAQIGAEMLQEAVAVEIDGQLHLVDSKAAVAAA